MQKFILAAFCVVALGAVFAFAQGNKQPKAAPTQWEYRVLKSERQDELNELGKDGWELVSVVPTSINIKGDQYDETRREFYLKRPIQ